MRIAVVGMGKIGLPLAVQYTRVGHTVIGCDIDSSTVDLINAGQEPFPGEVDLAKFLTVAVNSKLLTATTDTAAAVATAQAVVVVVPLFVNADAMPDFRAMDSAAEAVGRGLNPGSLVCFETTLPVGTTRKRLAPLLEAASGLVAEKDFHVVFSPERVLTGRVFEDLRKYPKLVGGLSANGERAGCEFYRQVLHFDSRDDLPKPNGVWPMGSAEAAELAKLAETTYRDVNIALANEFALFAQRSGIEITQVIEACNSQPFSHIHRPGIAVGGHCIPVYPRLYLWNDPGATVVRAARSANAEAPSFWIDALEERIGTLGGKRLVILGAAYRGGVKETAFSGAFEVSREAVRRGASAEVHDPLYSDDELRELGFVPFHRGSPGDVVVIQADHDEYASWSSQDVPGVVAVLDGRGIVQASSWPNAQILSVTSGLLDQTR